MRLSSRYTRWNWGRKKNLGIRLTPLLRLELQSTHYYITPYNSHLHRIKDRLLRCPCPLIKHHTLKTQTRIVLEFQAFLPSGFVGYERSVSRPCLCIFGGGRSVWYTVCIGSLLGPRANLEKGICLPCCITNPISSTIQPVPCSSDSCFIYLHIYLFLCTYVRACPSAYCPLATTYLHTCNLLISRYMSQGL
jgi:hypothetical protein